jgi:hypothetical protein
MERMKAQVHEPAGDYQSECTDKRENHFPSTPRTAAVFSGSDECHDSRNNYRRGADKHCRSDMGTDFEDA